MKNEFDKNKEDLMFYQRYPYLPLCVSLISLAFSVLVLLMVLF